MGIFDKIFKRKEKEPDIIREWAEAMIKAAKENPEERVDLSTWTTDNMHDMRHMFPERTENWTTDNMKDMTVMFAEAERQMEEEKQKILFNNILYETKNTLTDKSNEYNGLKKELESAKVEIERLREKLNENENNFKTLS